MIKAAWRDSSLRHRGVTEVIIALCVLMAVVTYLLPVLTSALLFFPPQGFTQPYRFITAAFLHGGFAHLLFNMLTLYVVGQNLEKILGRWRFVAVYLLSAVGGNMAVAAWARLTGDWFVGVVGASGAVFGLFGALIAFAGRQGLASRSLIVLVVVNLLYGLITPGISWQSHVGGLAVGYALARLWIRGSALVRPSTRTMKAKTLALHITATLLIGALIYAAGVLIYHSS